VSEGAENRVVPLRRTPAPSAPPGPSPRAKAMAALGGGGAFLVLAQPVGAQGFACYSDCGEEARPHVLAGLRAAVAFLELMERGE